MHINYLGGRFKNNLEDDIIGEIRMSIRNLLKIFNKRKNYLFPLTLVALNALLWYPALKFWFFYSWEQSYLVGMCGARFNFICMMQSHGILYLINYWLFGWNPSGWFLTAIILFTAAVLLVYKLFDFLFKNQTLAFIGAVLFSANVAHNDVVNFGSFTGHYALIFVSLLSGMLAYRQFSQAKKRVTSVFWYFMMLLAYASGLFVREVALVFPFWVLFFELYTNSFRFSRKYFLRLIKIFAPLGLFSLGYLLLREKYGGSPHDLIDAMVQLKMALLAQKRYGEYLWRGILAYGKFAGSHLIPYPIMNILRELASKMFNPVYVSRYFFSFAGFIYTGVMLWLIWFYRKIKTTRNLLIFAFLWFLVPTVFYSYSFTIDDYALVQPYTLDTTRWRYYAFFGTVLFWVTVGWRFYQYSLKKKSYPTRKLRSFFTGVVLITILVNFYLLRIEQRVRYLTVYKPARDFYSSFLKTFKTLPKDYVFYLAQGSNPLGDYIYEWYFTRQSYYPYLTEDRGILFGAGYMGMLLQRFLEGSANIDSTYFLDYDTSRGVVNKTQEARSAIFNQKEQVYVLERQLKSLSTNTLAQNRKHQIDIPLDHALHVEFPYYYELVVRQIASPGFSASSFSPPHNASLQIYERNRNKYLREAKVTVCGTAPAGGEGKPATHLVKEHLVDGNISSRSLWVADCRPAWIILDLGRNKKVGAVGFSGIDVGPALPTDYTIYASKDNIEWTKVLEIKSNRLHERIDKFSEIEEARFIKFEINQTKEGGMATISEIEIFEESSLAVLEFYGNDLSRLIDDSHNYGQGYLRFSWKTNPDNDPPGKELINKSTYIPLVADGQKRKYMIEPNEGEFYSSGGQFLKRFISSIHLDFVGPPAMIEVYSVRVVPKFPIKQR